MANWRDYNKSSSSNWRSYVYGEDEANRIMEERNKQHLAAQKAYQEKAKQDEERRKSLSLPSVDKYAVNKNANNFSYNDVLYTLMKKSNYDPNKDTGDLAEVRKKNFLNDVQYYYKNQDKFKKNYIVDKKPSDNVLSNAATKLGNTKVGKFLDRLATESADTATFKTGLSNWVDKKETGSKALDTAADIIGMGAGMMVAPSGSSSFSSGLNTIGTKVAENNISKNISNSLAKTAFKYAPNIKTYDAVTNIIPSIGKGAVEFGVMGGVESYAKGNSVKDIATDAAKNALIGGAFGGVTKSIGMALPKIKNSAIKTTTYEDSMNINSPKGKLTPKVNVINEASKAEIPKIQNPSGKLNQNIIETPKINYKVNDEVVINDNGMINGGILTKANKDGTFEVKLETNKGTEYRTVKPSVNDTFKTVVSKTQSLPISQRDFSNVGNKSVKSYQFEHPELKADIQKEANILKGEVERTILPEKGSNYVNGERIGFGNESIKSPSIEQIKNATGESYANINKALDNIIKDNGAENNALSKKIELIIDERLSKGYTDDIYGTEIPANKDYISKKSSIEGQKVELPSPKNVITANMNFKNTKATKSQTFYQAASTEDIQNIADVEPNAKIVSSSNDKISIKDNFKNAYNRIVDINNPIKKVGDKTYTLATNSKNVGGTVDYILKNGLVDRQGKKIGKSLKEIAEDIPKGQENQFWEYALQKHNIARSMEGKPIYSDFTPGMSAEKAKYFESINPTWKEKADNITKWIDDFMNEWGVNSGITDKELYTSLRKKYPYYIPTNRDFSALEQSSLLTNGRGFVNQSNPMKKATGSDRNITDPIENIMNLVNRTVRTARYNEVGQSMVKAITENPEKYKNVAELVPIGQEVNPNVKNIVSVLIDGKPVNVQINDKSLLDSLQKLNKANVGDIEKAAKQVTGLFKSLITQKNPVFAIRNIARDIPTAYVNGSEANPFKYLYDLGKAGKDLATNSPIAQQYKALGGGGSNFFNSDNVAKSAKELTKTSIPKKIGNAIEAFNNLTESAPRLAEFKRVANKTGDMQKALYAASDVSTNFSRGGDLAKQIDSFVPYFNASIQGMDKLRRQFKDKPIATILKGATSITAPTLILNHINKDNPQYQQLDNRTKDNYYLVPKDDGTFFKLPKSRELGVLFGSLTERILRQANGEDNSFKGFGNTVATNFSPSNIVENNIAAPLVINLARNKDFANRTIVPQNMQDLTPRYQYDETTSEIGKKIGEIANLSPKQIDYLIKSYTGVVGQLLLPATTKANNNGVFKPVTTQFISDPLYSNQTMTDFYDNYDKYKNLAADKNFISNIPSEVVTKEEKAKNAYAKASKEISDLLKQARKADTEGDTIKVKKLRLKMIELANKANKEIK